MTAIQLLFSLILVGVTVIMIMLYDHQTPLAVGGPVKCRHVAMTKVLLLLMFVLLLVIMSCVYNFIMIQKIHDYLFELTLLGFLAFLVLLIDKLCNYKGELSNQRKVITVLNTRKQLELGTMMNEITTLRRRLKLVESQLEKEAKEKTIVATRHKNLESKHDKETKEKTILDTRLKKLESELEKKKKDFHAAEANGIALRKQCEGLLVEYNRLLEENEFVKTQLRLCDWRLSHSGGKKDI